MPYKNELQRYLDIFALSLSLKQSTTWSLEDHNKNYSALFSIYSKMIEQDQENFFTSSTDKEQIIHSLERSKDFYTFTDDKQLLATLKQMKNNDPREFMLLPLFYSAGNHLKDAHASGMLLYKENEAYKGILVDKQSLMSESQINVVTIPTENLPSLCHALFSNKEQPNMGEAYDILYTILEHSAPKEVLPLTYTMHSLKEGNSLVKQIEATLKTALFHCHHDLFASQTFEPIKWNDSTLSTLEMHEHLLSAIKDECKGPSEPFDLLSECYKLRKEATLYTSDLTPQKKEMIHQKVQMRMKKYPEIQQILSGENVYKFSNGIVNKQIDFFTTSSAEKENNKTKKIYIRPKKVVKEKVLLFEKIAAAKEKTASNLKENNTSIKTKSQPLTIIR